MAIVLALLMMVSVASSASVEVYWDSEEAEISITVHRYRPSSTSGWATEEFSIFQHKAEYSTGMVAGDIDHSCNTYGMFSALNGVVDVIAMNIRYEGPYFTTTMVSGEHLEGTDFIVNFEARTFLFPTHMDNIWILESQLLMFGSGEASVSAVRSYSRIRNSDGSSLGEYYALLESVIEGDEISALVGSGFFPDERHDVWWGDEKLYFNLQGESINAHLEAVGFPLIDISIEPGIVDGEIVRPK